MTTQNYFKTKLCIFIYILQYIGRCPLQALLSVQNGGTIYFVNFTAPGQARIQIQNGGLTGKEEVFIQNIRRYILKNMTFENEYNFNQHRPKKKKNK